MYILYMEKGSKKNNKNIVLHSLQKNVGQLHMSCPTFA